VTHVHSPRATTFSPLRNHELLKEVVKLRHDFSKQECEHQNYAASLRYRLEKETQAAINTSEAEKFHFEFEIKSLEQELDARSRIRRNEEERLITRRECHDSELATLRANFEKSEDLVGRSMQYKDSEIRTRDQDGNRISGDIKTNYEKRLAVIKEDEERINVALRAQIDLKEKELYGEYSNFIS